MYLDNVPAMIRHRQYKMNSNVSKMLSDKRKHNICLQNQIKFAKKTNKPDTSARSLRV